MVVKKRKANLENARNIVNEEDEVELIEEPVNQQDQNGNIQVPITKPKTSKLSSKQEAKRQARKEEKRRQKEVK